MAVCNNENSADFLWLCTMHVPYLYPPFNLLFPPSLLACLLAVFFSDTLRSLSLACHRSAFWVLPSSILFVSGSGCWPEADTLWERGCNEGTAMSGMSGGRWRRCQFMSASVVSRRASVLLYPVLHFTWSFCIVRWILSTSFFSTALVHKLNRTLFRKTKGKVLFFFYVHGISLWASGTICILKQEDRRAKILFVETLQFLICHLLHSSATDFWCPTDTHRRRLS